MIFLFRRLVSDASHPHCVHNAERSREPSSKSEKLLPHIIVADLLEGEDWRLQNFTEGK